MNEQRTTVGKALRINLDPQIYGTFAEIGAGQEVARFFFQAGKASQTIAKTISAYDMIYSDEIYGKEKNGRYVCESRLLHMLDKEYSLLERRLKNHRGNQSLFFALANTVTTAGKGQSHGWMGVRFQKKPMGPSNDIIVHFRLLDRSRLQQQEALGILGVNLMNVAFFFLNQQTQIIPELVDGLKPGQVAIDVLKFSGPDTKNLNQGVFALELVKRDLCDAVLFSPQMEIIHLPDYVFQKNLVVLRGSFDPLTKIHTHLLDRGIAFAETCISEKKTKSKKSSTELAVLLELTTSSWNKKSSESESAGRNEAQQTEYNQNEMKALLKKVQNLTKLGHGILVSNFFLFYKLKRHLRMYNDEKIAMLLGAAHLEKLFDEKYYSDLEGGILEGLSKLLNDDTQLYIYPHKTKELCLTSDSFFPKEPMNQIYQYFKKSQKILDIANCDDIEIERKV
ncbi:MAG: hypothetical protein ACK5P5_00480 [Pseudobdellovibrionaceae bacterium]